MKVVKGSDNFVANTAAILSQTITSPGEPLVVSFEDEAGEPPESPAAGAKRNNGRGSGKPAKTGPHRPAIYVSTAYMVTLLAFIVLTVLSGIAMAVMAAFWNDPTTMQTSAFENVSSVLKVGIGVIGGLLTGKNLK